jgi:hypothetical protein
MEDNFDNDYGEENLFPSDGNPMDRIATKLLDVFAIKTGIMEIHPDEYMKYNGGNLPPNQVLDGMTKSFIGALHSIQDNEIHGIQVDSIEGTILLVDSRGEGWIRILLNYNEELENYEICKDLHESLLIYQNNNILNEYSYSIK